MELSRALFLNINKEKRNDLSFINGGDGVRSVLLKVRKGMP